MQEHRLLSLLSTVPSAPFHRAMCIAVGCTLEGVQKASEAPGQTCMKPVEVEVEEDGECIRSPCVLVLGNLAHTVTVRTEEGHMDLVGGQARVVMMLWCYALRFRGTRQVSSQNVQM